MPALAIIVLGISYVAYNYTKSSGNTAIISGNIADSIKSLERPMILTAAALAVYSYTRKRR